MLNTDSYAQQTEKNVSGAVVPFRHQILQQLLENKDGLSIEELTRCLKISRAAVQKHFTLLEKEGLIVRHNLVKTMGRPSINYVLTSKGLAYFPKRYNLLSEMVLREISTELTPEQLANFMQKVGKKLADQYRARVDGKTENERRIFLFDLMQKLGFQVEMKQDPASDAVEIHAYNCIYHDVAQQFHEICLLDQTLIAELMDKKIDLRHCMAKGDGMCCFNFNSDKC